MTSDPIDTHSPDDGQPEDGLGDAENLEAKQSEVEVPEADPRSHQPLRGQIVHVTGRKATGGESGLPALDELVLQNDDGSVLEFCSPTSGEVGMLTGLAQIPHGVFTSEGGAPICPICLDGAATEREHVPQEALGGQRMTAPVSRVTKNSDRRWNWTLRTGSTTR